VLSRLRNSKRNAKYCPHHSEDASHGSPTISFAAI
jgi:hypothetical protein